ncbi:hypothetical protein BgiBS90_028311 [Biomphalaria glabrata]|nr:hypothetical protein BgiBS90_028311 [Biomphalaria glabrata]
MRSSSILFIWMVFSLHGHQRTEGLLHRDDADIVNVKPKDRPTLESFIQPNSSGISTCSSVVPLDIHILRVTQFKMFFNVTFELSSVLVNLKIQNAVYQFCVII